MKGPEAHFDLLNDKMNDHERDYPRELPSDDMILHYGVANCHQQHAQQDEGVDEHLYKVLAHREQLGWHVVVESPRTVIQHEEIGDPLKHQNEQNSCKEASQ